MRKFIVLILVMLSSAGCSSIPFTNVNYVSMDRSDPQIVLRDFAAAVPDRLQVVNSVVFQYKWQSFSALGYLDVDTIKRTFAVSCLNPVGVKLFELSGDADSIKSIFVLKELERRGDLSKIVGEDIKKIYLNTVPARESTIERERYKFVFSEQAGAGVMKYIFAGSQNMLVEKAYYEKKRHVWSVFYYEYLQDNGKSYPAGVMLKNYRFGYNLIIRLKSIR